MKTEYITCPKCRERIHLHKTEFSHLSIVKVYYCLHCNREVRKEVKKI